MAQYCHKCGNKLDEEAVFCPKCGAKVASTAAAGWTCSSCGANNDESDSFCSKCGTAKNSVPAVRNVSMVSTKPSPPENYDYNDEELTGFQAWLAEGNNKRFLIIGVVLTLIVGIASFLFFRGMSEDDYLKNYGAVSRTLSESHDMLVNNVTMSSVKEEQVGQLKKDLEQEKQEIDALAETFAGMKPFRNYEKQHKDVIELLQKESSVFDSVITICSNPITPDNDALLEKVKNDTDAIKTLSADISVPNTSLTTASDITMLYQHLQNIVTEQRKINKEKMEKLEAMKKFFNAMDDAIQKYDTSKTDMHQLLQTARKGDMLWMDYFRQLDNVKSARQGVKNKVSSLSAPAGTEALRSELIDILSESIRYCEQMRIAANLQFRDYYVSAGRVEQKAKEMDPQIQTSYDKFMAKYKAEKERLTDIKNL